jgi:hypothetical protein
MEPEKKPSWYEPYSGFRKFCWYWCFITALICAPGAFVAEKQDIKIKYAGQTAFNLFICWLAFDSTFKKEEENEQ